jgi:hypothetical protein
VTLVISIPERNGRLSTSTWPFALAMTPPASTATRSRQWPRTRLYYGEDQDVVVQILINPEIGKGDFKR